MARELFDAERFGLRRAGHVGVRPRQMSPLLQPRVGEERSRLGSEPVVGSEDDRGLRAGQGDDVGEHAVQLPEILEAALADPLPRRRERLVLRRRDVAPAEMLDAVDTVEDDRRQVRRLLPHQRLQDPAPLLLAPDVDHHPLLVLLGPHSLDGLGLGGDVHGQLPGVEAGELLQAVVQPGRMAAEPHLAPRHPARHHAAADPRRREHEREVEGGRPEAVPVGERPDRLRVHVPRGRDADVMAPDRLLAEEVEDSVMAGAAARGERRPGGRGQGRDHRLQVPANAGGHEVREERHHAVPHQRVENGERRSVEAEEDGATTRHRALRAAARPVPAPSSRCWWMKSTHSPTGMSGRARCPTCANSSTKGNTCL